MAGAGAVLSFSILFIFLPSASLFIDSFRNREGQFTLENIFALFQPPIPPPTG